jgi:outer membrane protein
MRLLQKPLILTCLFACCAGLASAQNGIEIEPATGGLGWLTRPYQARYVPPIRLNNSSRLQTLIRAGNVYLTAQDAVALAVENNPDIELQRYGPLLAQEVLKRAQSGGALRSVGLGLSQGPQSVSLQGVSTSSGGGVGLSAGSGVSSGGGIVTQLGPQIPSLDPTVVVFANFAHSTTPQSNTFLTGTTSLIADTRQFQAQYSQNWIYGTSASLTYASQYTNLNSQFFSLNPYTSGFLDFQITQNLLQGFGSAVNGRNIRVQKNNVKVTDLQFKQQVILTVSAVLNLYWDLVAFDEDVRARKQQLAAAQQLFEDNKKQVEIGALAEIEITRAEAQVYAAQQDLVIAQTNRMQQETVLKNALTRDGIAAAGLSGIHVVTLDAIKIPSTDDLRPAEEMMAEALTNRVEIEQSKLNIDSNKMNLVGIKNSLKPTLQAFAELTNNGLTGDLTALGAQQPPIYYFSGGYGNMVAQIFRRNFPNYSAGFALNIPLRNRAAQSDYVTSMLELRQNELNLKKNVNQVRVDVDNAIVGLQQARARYEAAVKGRELQQQTLDSDQKRFIFGAGTAYQVVQDQRDLASALSSEVQAMANMTHARITLDQALGRTLDVNNVAVSEALKGHLSRQSTAPAEPAKGGMQ